VATLRAHGIEAHLPPGFEGRVFVRRPMAGEATRPVAHFATFPLPANVADFGSGAVQLMGPDDIFAVLFEYGPESVGTPLFGRHGAPHRLGPSDFSPVLLRRAIGGQSGTQWFFTTGGRPFTFFAVLGSHRLRHQLVPRLNQLLASLVVTPVDEPVAASPPGLN